MAKQRFNRGDKVMITKFLDCTMSHFPSGLKAIVIGSYNDLCGPGSKECYELDVKGHGKIAWYREHQLTLIKAAPFVSIKFNGK